MPVYNSEKYLHKSINSIIQQTYKNWELILVDDGSNDDSYKICCEFANDNVGIRVFQQPNLGSGPARNEGIKNITGEYVLFCDADDFYEIDALEIFSDSIFDKNSDLIISNYREFNYDILGNIQVFAKKRIDNEEISTQLEVRKTYWKLCEMHMIHAPWAKLYKASIIKKYDIKFENIRRCQDIVFNLRYYTHVKSISITNKITYNYLTPEGSIYLSKFPKNMFDILKQVSLLQCSTLKEWGVVTSEGKRYFNTIMLKNIYICLRLNYKNNWNLSKKEQKNYYKKLLSDEITREVVENEVTGRFNTIVKLVIRSKVIVLVQFLCLGLLASQKYLPSLVNIIKKN